MTANVRLICGDCLEVMPTLPAMSFDAIITDIPYGTTACSWDSVIPFPQLWDNLKRLAKPRAAIVLFGSQPFASALVMSNPQMFRYEWIWKKRRITGHLDVSRRPLRAHEVISVFSANRHVYNPQMQRGEVHKRGAKNEYGGQARCYGKHERILSFSDEYYPRDVIEFAADKETTVTLAQRPNKTPMHPTQKPVALMEYLVRTYTHEGDMVLDFTMGSGTTLVACVNTNRNGIGVEKDTKYFEIAQRRITEARSQLMLNLMAT